MDGRKAIRTARMTPRSVFYLLALACVAVLLFTWLLYILDRCLLPKDECEVQTWPRRSPGFYGRGERAGPGHYWVWWMDEWVHGYWNGKHWTVESSGGLPALDGISLADSLPIGPRWEVPLAPANPPAELCTVIPATRGGITTTATRRAAERSTGPEWSRYGVDPHGFIYFFMPENPKNDAPLLPRGPNCPACHVSRVHTVEEFREFHPLAGHGFSEGKWSDPRAERAHMLEVERMERAKRKHPFESEDHRTDRPCGLCGKQYRDQIHG